MSTHGVYGESAIVPAHAVARYPDRFSPVQGASIWTQYLTVWGALVHLGKLGLGQSVLITAASSSVGLAAIEFVNLLGAKPIAVTRASAKKKALLDAGALHVIASAEEDLPAMVRKYTDGRGAEPIFDPVAGRFIETLAECAAHNALIIEYGLLSGEPTPFPLFPAFQKALAVRAYTLYEFVTDPVLRPKAQRFVYEHLEKGKLNLTRSDRCGAPIPGIKPASRQDCGHSSLRKHMLEHHALYELAELATIRPALSTIRPISMPLQLDSSWELMCGANLRARIELQSKYL